MEIDIETLNPYKPRPRRKTNVNRYEPNKGGPVAGQSSPRTKRSQKRATMMKRNTSRVNQKFQAKNVKAGRLTLAANVNLGIFKKGKTSEPIGCPQVSYLNFSETEFLKKEVQPPEVPEERTRQASRFEKSSQRFPTEYYSDTFIEKELFESLGNCWQLSIPYEEYTPITSNDQFISLKELKELLNREDHTRLKRKRNSMDDNATRSPKKFRADNSIYNRMENWNAPSWIHEPDTTIGTSTTGRDMFLDAYLEKVKEFNGDMSMGYLAELVEAEESNPDNCEPELADSHAYGLQNSIQKGSHTPLRAFEKTRPIDKPISMIAKTVNNSSANLGMMQKRRDNVTSLNALDAWHEKDMQKDIAIGDCGAAIFSSLDDYQFGRRATPVCTTNQPCMPTSAHPGLQDAAAGIAPHRRFWRCNKLY